MVKQTIQIFARVKPTKKPISVYTVDCEEQGGSLEFGVPRDLADGFINNKRENYKFSVLAGFNGTIFAYGQTGSGKTFTITGGAERYSDRGIIPRTLSYLYQHFSKDSSMVYSTHISYLEIYNESGYDLLNPQHEASCLEDLPRVTVMEDPDQNIHLKNLSLLQSANEEEALDLLFLGDTNRMIAETPMNQASTRSHCIFTIHLCSKVLGSATVRHSKLHLVDLAGSERVGKTGVEGQILTEAKYINLSLHYLEQVIIALSEKNRSHIPYRNSMMTSVLRDSLGGNCMTTMIATVSAEKRNIDESISTCRFAQRVALIKNDALLNEELDPALLIVRLKKEIQSLKEELALVTGEQRSDELTQEEILKLEEQIRVFLEDPDPEVTLDLGPDMKKIYVCFSLLKARVQDGPCTQNGLGKGSNTSPGLFDVEESQKNTEVQTLRDILTQRDNEISILVSMLKKEKRKVQEVTSQLAQFHNQKPSLHNSSQSSTTLQAEECDMHSRHLMTRKRAPELSVGQQEAFEVFLRDHEDRSAFEDNIAILKHRFAEAKTLGEQVNHIRIQVNELKTQLKMRRMQVAAQGLAGDQTESESDPVEDRILNRIEEEKKNYKITSGHLKGLKTEIEHLQLLREKSKVKLQLEFEEWWTQETTRLQGHRAQNSGHSHTSPLSSMLIRDTNSKGYDTDPEERRQKEQTSFYSRDQRNGDNTSNPVTTTKLRALPSTGISSTSIPLTGDKQTDADILAFVKARHNLLNRTGVAK
ncbi:kinesin-like protein KIF6 isoform X2 [Xyrauchen texanus]|uniref:kinesin-like protein KIF6 isoform X2 n=1 Tax=Xyrauchen texanus TaxID=154827 RepID=UPI002241CDD7|nr:kinesin-like protein KIF6 isoform X2 [Xyrauchen texanus]